MKQALCPAALVLLLAGCAGPGTAEVPAVSPSPAAESAPLPSPSQEPVWEGPAPEEVFAQLTDPFVFVSGAGAWGTIMTIQPDGTFTGRYDASDLDIHYFCVFNGSLSQPVQVGDYTYSVTLESLEQEGTEGEEHMEDAIRYICSTPYGIEGAEELMLYAPGAPVEELPEDFLIWAGIRGKDRPETDRKSVV